MNKEEFYNSIVEITKKTGQGAPSFIEFKIGSSVVDELIEDGLLKRVAGRKYTHLPNDNWICLTKGYCVEEDNNERALDYIRFYLGILSENDPFGSAALVNIRKNPRDYADWLDLNKEKIEETQILKLLKEDYKNLSQDTIDFLKDREWYINNLSLKECIIGALEGNDKDDKSIDLSEQTIELTKQVITLYKNKGDNDAVNRSQKELEKYKQDIIDSKKNIKFRNKLILVMRECKQDNMKVQDYFSQYFKNVPIK